PIFLRLTEAEAGALATVAGATMEYPDALEASLQSPARRCAAWRAYERLNRILHRQRPADPLALLAELTGYCEEYRRAGCEEMPDRLLARCRKALDQWEKS